MIDATSDGGFGSRVGVRRPARYVDELRQVALLLQAENARLHERLATVVAQIAALPAKSPPEQL